MIQDNKTILMYSSSVISPAQMPNNSQKNMSSIISLRTTMHHRNNPNLLIRNSGFRSQNVPTGENGGIVVPINDHMMNRDIYRNTSLNPGRIPSIPQIDDIRLTGEG